MARTPEKQREEERMRAEFFARGGVVHRYPSHAKVMPHVWIKRLPFGRKPISKPKDNDGSNNKAP